MRALITILLIALSTTPASSQQTESGPTKLDEPNLTTEIVRLLHTDPDSAVGMIQQLFQPPIPVIGGMGEVSPRRSALRLASDFNTSSVVVRGTEAEVRQVIQLLTELDQPSTPESSADEEGNRQRLVVKYSDNRSLNETSLELLRAWCSTRDVGVVADAKTHSLILSTRPDQPDAVVKQVEKLLDRVLLSEIKPAAPEIWKAKIAVIAEADQIPSNETLISKEVSEAAEKLGFKNPGIAGQLSLSVIRAPGAYAEGTTHLSLATAGENPKPPASLQFEGTWSDRSNGGEGGPMRIMLKVAGPVAVGVNSEDRDLIELTSDIIAKSGRTTVIGGGSTGSQNLGFAISWTKESAEE